MEKVYMVCFENSKWTIVKAYSPEGAYAGLICWYNGRAKAIVIDTETKEIHCFFRHSNKHVGVQECIHCFCCDSCELDCDFRKENK